MQKNCGNCSHIKQTSPGQIFWLCRFFASDQTHDKGVLAEFGYDYVITHCHVQPEAPACPYYTEEAMYGPDGERLRKRCKAVA